MSKFKLISQYKSLKQAITHACIVLSELAVGDDLNVVFDIDDTLIFDDNRQTPNIQVKHLLEVAKAHGYKIHLVTAREKNNEVIKFTRDELRRHQITYDTLALAPKKSRGSMTDVALWKHSERSKHLPVLSVGDQWGDILPLGSDFDIDALNEFFKVKDGPWLLIEVNDKITKFGLKLMA
jgi:predicted HAD superfamily phosphohydrolase YqeG